LISLNIVLAMPPTIVFFHSAWHSVQFFEKAIVILEPLGYDPGRSDQFSQYVSSFKSFMNDPNLTSPRLGQSACLQRTTHRRSEQSREGERRRKERAVTKLALVAVFVAEESVSLESAVGGRPDSWIINPLRIRC
jgi:hypothetical protein